MNKLVIILIMVFLPMSITNANPEIIFKSKCASCHTTVNPTNSTILIAPTIMGVMRHIKMHYPDKNKAIIFMKNFILNPSKNKAICTPRKIEQFGLMPSQKGLVTNKDLDIILPWLYDNFPPKDFKGMGRHRNLK